MFYQGYLLLPSCWLECEHDAFIREAFLNEELETTCWGCWSYKVNRSWALTLQSPYPPELLWDFLLWDCIEILSCTVFHPSWLFLLESGISCSKSTAHDWNLLETLWFDTFDPRQYCNEAYKPMPKVAFYIHKSFWFENTKNFWHSYFSQRRRPSWNCLISEHPWCPEGTATGKRLRS